MGKEQFEKWSETYRAEAVTGAELMWPTETLIRLLKGRYVPGLDRDHAGRKVLEVGFGNGNNLMLLGSLGMVLHGVEVTDDICSTTTDRMAALGYEADLRIGENTALPFEDDTFDLLVSWNVLHYEPTEDRIKAAIDEYARVLKPGGRFIVSTTGPDHLILDGASVVGPHQYRIGRDDDFRKGEVFFYFDSERYIHYYFDPRFHDVMVGRTRDHLITDVLDWWIVTGVK